jgi:hypothetical protein
VHSTSEGSPIPLGGMLRERERAALSGWGADSRAEAEPAFLLTFTTQIETIVAEEEKIVLEGPPWIFWQ